jgi:uncharacterized protein
MKTSKRWKTSARASCTATAHTSAGWSGSLGYELSLLCGACCRRVGAVPGHDLPVKPDGSCGHLRGSLCDIYDTRPMICRVDETLDVLVVKYDVDRRGLHNANVRMCNKFQVEDGIPETFRLVEDAG